MCKHEYAVSYQHFFPWIICTKCHTKWEISYVVEFPLIVLTVLFSLPTWNVIESFSQLPALVQNALHLLSALFMFLFLNAVLFVVLKVWGTTTIYEKLKKEW